LQIVLCSIYLLLKGTGKTFVSISALLVMLKNIGPGDPPLIIAAQTNHALDQLLTLLAPFEANFLRLGGRTSKDNKVILERTLYEVRRTSRMKGIKDNYRNSRGGLDSVGELLTRALHKSITPGILDAQILLDMKLISNKQFESLHDDEWTTAEDPMLPEGPLALWLGREQLVRNPSGCPPINMGFEEEDLDPEFEQLQELEVEAGKKDDDDIDALNGLWIPLQETFTGRRSTTSTKKIQRLLKAKNNLWDIPISCRGDIYRYFQRKIKEEAVSDFRAHSHKYLNKAEDVKIAKWQRDATLISYIGIKVIGCTTTGLSKYRGLIACLNPLTLLIEEAAETLEGTVLAASFESVQQIILVGDHLQLQAHCSVPELEKHPYNLSVSMFERLINNGVPYTMLNRQRRMIPELRHLLSNNFYPELRDHPSVLDREINRRPVPGVRFDSFFYHHNWPESRDDAASRYNMDEAEMIVHFFRYLVLNGVQQSQITVLTFYNGQRRTILKLLKCHPDLKMSEYFNVFTVDSYQGEENDIVLLSLVRSNEHHSIGFLENRNRAVVALSRARRGLYIFGNAINLVCATPASEELWGNITDDLRVNDRLSYELPLRCSTHQKDVLIREPYEWDRKGLTGGCDIKCHDTLECGHLCPYKCHP
jgi:helicase required for RNAi-mediated heterochromatin assembly 1